jgi:hypothetical protein
VSVILSSFALSYLNPLFSECQEKSQSVCECSQMVNDVPDVAISVRLVEEIDNVDNSFKADWSSVDLVSVPEEVPDLIF